MFGQNVSIREKPLRDTNLISVKTHHIRNASLPIITEIKIKNVFDETAHGRDRDDLLLVKRIL